MIGNYGTYHSKREYKKELKNREKIGKDAERERLKEKEIDDKKKQLLRPYKLTLGLIKNQKYLGLEKESYLNSQLFLNILKKAKFGKFKGLGDDLIKDADSWKYWHHFHKFKEETPPKFNGDVNDLNLMVKQEVKEYISDMEKNLAPILKEEKEIIDDLINKYKVETGSGDFLVRPLELGSHYRSQLYDYGFDILLRVGRYQDTVDMLHQYSRDFGDESDGNRIIRYYSLDNRPEVWDNKRKRNIKNRNYKKWVAEYSSKIEFKIDKIVYKIEKELQEKQRQSHRDIEKILKMSISVENLLELFSEIINLVTKYWSSQRWKEISAQKMLSLKNAHPDYYLKFKNYIQEIIKIWDNLLLELDLKVNHINQLNQKEDFSTALTQVNFLKTFMDPINSYFKQWGDSNTELLTKIGIGVDKFLALNASYENLKNDVLRNQKLATQREEEIKYTEFKESQDKVRIEISNVFPEIDDLISQLNFSAAISKNEYILRKAKDYQLDDIIQKIESFRSKCEMLKNDFDTLNNNLSLIDKNISYEDYDSSLKLCLEGLKTAKMDRFQDLYNEYEEKKILVESLIEEKEKAIAKQNEIKREKKRREKELRAELTIIGNRIINFDFAKAIRGTEAILTQAVEFDLLELQPEITQKITDYKIQQQAFNEIKRIAQIYEEIELLELASRLNINFDVLKNMIENMILKTEIDASIKNKVLKINKSITNALKEDQTIEKPIEEKKLVKTKDFHILRGGNWKIEGDRSIFHYKVKVKNDSSFVMTNIQVILGGIPAGLELISDKLIEFPILNPRREIAPTFKLIATDNCVGNEILSSVNFTDQNGTLHTIQTDPFEIKYVCNLLNPKEISKEEFDIKTELMDYKRFSIMSDHSIEHLEQKIASIVKECNFSLLQEIKSAQMEGYRKFEGFAQGIYDKQDVGISLILKEVENGTEVAVKAMSERSEKLTDILKDFNIKLDDIKDINELILEYTSHIEELFVQLGKLDDIEAYLKDHLPTDWEKIKDIWKLYRNGEIDLKTFLKEGVKIVGKRFIKKIIEKYV